MRSAVELLAVLAFLAVMPLSVAQAQGDCGCTDDIEEKPRVEATWFGLSLDRVIDVGVRGELFRIPVGYIMPWPRRNDMNNDFVAYREGLWREFAFWHPSGRYPEHDRWSVPRYHPCEAGRPPPGDDEYVVEGIIMWPLLDSAPPPYRLPKTMIANVLSRFDRRDGYTLASELGLTRVYPNNPFPIDLTQEKYILQDETDVSLYMTCDSEQARVPNPLCEADVYYESLNLAFYFRFSRRDLPNWRASVEMARDLILSWHVGSDGDAEE